MFTSMPCRSTGTIHAIKPCIELFFVRWQCGEADLHREEQEREAKMRPHCVHRQPASVRSTVLPHQLRNHIGDMSGNGGRRRQVRQRTSKDAAYAKRLQDVGGAAGASTNSSRHDGEPSAAVGAAAAAAAVSTPSGGGGRKRPRSAADSEASASPPIAAAADADGTSRRARRRGPGPGVSRMPRARPTPGWSCAACTLHNPSRKRKCEVCGAAKPAVVSSDGASGGASAAPAAASGATASAAPSAVGA